MAKKALPQWPTERVLLAEMKPAPYNPREISEDALTALGHSLDSFGQVQEIVWNRRTGHIVGGHMRIRALQARGETSAKACIVDLDDADEKELNLALNNPALQGSFNMKRLSDVLKEIKAKKTRADFAAAGLEALAKQLPVFNGLKETPHADDPRRYVSAREAVAHPRADVRMFQLFFSAAEFDRFAQMSAELAEDFGLDSTSAVVKRLVEDAHRAFRARSELAEGIRRGPESPPGRSDVAARPTPEPAPAPPRASADAAPFGKRASSAPSASHRTKARASAASHRAGRSRGRRRSSPRT